MRNISVGVIDYGAGNFRSVWEAFAALDTDLVRIVDSTSLGKVSHLVLPGVGSFPNAMGKLRKLAIVESLREAVIEKQLPFLGICVGMQLLADVGFEGEKTYGLGVLGGRVVALSDGVPNFSNVLPHIGWNAVAPGPGSRAFSEDSLLNEFYFLHSNHLLGADSSALVSYAKYGVRFAAAIEKDNLLGVQFHPEKSQENGMRLLRKFLEF